MKRLCFLSPDTTHARRVVDVLRADGLEEKHIYVIARAGAPLEDLPDGGPDDDDFLPAFERGVAFGGVSGLFLGLVAMAFPPAGIVVGGGGVLLVGLAGASVGGLLTGAAGAAFPSSRLEAFEGEIEAGKILVMVDVPKERINAVNELIHHSDPDVIIEGVEPATPIFPR